MPGQPGLFDRDERYAARAIPSSGWLQWSTSSCSAMNSTPCSIARTGSGAAGHRCDRHLAAAANPLPRTDPATAATDPFGPMRPQTSPQNRFFEVSS
jgi:hypothetical protein